jgi:polar amino acid transport system permease protein
MLSADLYEQLLDGAWVSIQVTLLALAWGTAVAVVLGVARLTVRNRLVHAAIRVYVEVLRGVSAIILLFWCYYALPPFLDINLESFQAAVLALGLNLSAYGTEIVRGAVQSVPQGQTEAAIAVNLSPLRRIWSVTLPQAAVTVLPPYGNLSIEILKASALVSLLPQLDDLMTTANTMRTNRVAETEDIFLAVLILYFVFAQIGNGLVRLCEWYFSRGLHLDRPNGRESATRRLAGLTGALRIGRR